MSDWLSPSPDNAARVARRMNLMREPARALLRPAVKVIATDPLPPEGPALLLSNHVTMIDPVLIGLATRRAVHWMATETLFGPGALGAAHKHLGALPKTRFRADMRSVRLLKGWLDAGAVVGVFPEGERTWTGAVAPLQPGIGRLVRMLGLPVYTARLINAYRLWPRWSGRPRRGTVSVEISGPHTFTRADRPDAIQAALAEALQVTPDQGSDLPIRGRRLATGLSNLVYACPSCGQEEALEEQGDALQCRSCAHRWVADAAGNLTDDAGTAPLLEVLDGLRRTTLARWQAGLEGPALTSARLTLTEPARDSPVIGVGQLQLYPDRLVLQEGDAVRWSVPLSDINNINVEFQRTLEFRCRDQLLRADIPEGSAWRWPWSVQWWAAR